MHRTIAAVLVAASLAGMGRGLHPKTLINSHLQNGSLLELAPTSPLEVLLD